MTSSRPHSRVDKVKKLNAIGIALSAERSHSALLRAILQSARELTQADAGSLYLVNAATQTLSFAFIQNESLQLDVNCAVAERGAQFPDIPLYLESGQANDNMVVVQSVLTATTVRVDDVYNNHQFDFSGTKAFDGRTGYRSQAFLTVPMRNHEGDVIGALQLINKKVDDVVTHFDDDDCELTESLASQGAVALTNQNLITELHQLFDRFTEVIATAIDAKSPSTGAHCRRVPDATMMIAKAASGAEFPGLEEFTLSPADEYELRIASWLHDCGKIITPHHVMEKSTKLETVRDGIDAVCERLQLAAKDLELQWFRQDPSARQPRPELDAQLAAMHATEDFLRKVNIGGEFLSDSDIARIEELAGLTWTDSAGQIRPVITAEECQNLCIRRGTLNAEERKIMEDHMVHTVAMLEKLPFPKHLQRVPEYACGHHERMDGRGYPRGLTRDQMSIPARMMGVADVFEALTAHERPYKKPMPLSQALGIMKGMVENYHLDPDIFALFVSKKVYLDYAKKHLKAEQLDSVDEDALLHYNFREKG
ncbi:MAG: GAF domain-containing protein [Aliidiomarina sp.]|uniref:HD family phosphohydrolase n=1 Tax=Aliidiomarina sp. TaxID=1872439 RepID=UPI0025BF987E|nr:HD family phosphohydrolase [Aliidiomarina sp.]MCH8500752.1 GAF domain-containing protein [Aliidiomarina sp.]